MSELRKIRITHIHSMDAFYHSRRHYIGLTGTFEIASSHDYKGYYAGGFRPDVIPNDLGNIRYIYFCGVRYILCRTLLK